MKHLRLSIRFLLISTVIIISLQLSCTFPNRAESDLVEVSISQIWLTDQTDQDQDGFFSHVGLRFMPEVKPEKHRLFFRLYYCQTSATNTSALLFYTQTETFFIGGKLNPDTLKFDLGLPPQELKQGSYNFFIRVYDPDAPDFILNEATPSTHLQLEAIPVESDNTDAILTIKQVMALKTDDYDADGYASHLTTTVQLYSSRPQRSVDLIIQAVAEETNVVSAIDTIYNIFLPDTLLMLPVETNLHLLTGNVYDLKFSIRFADHHVVEYIYGKEENFELGHLLLESFEEETRQQIILSYLDEEPFEGSEKYDSGSLDLAHYAVRFFRPPAAIFGRIRVIRIHGAAKENYILLKAWTDLNGVPDQDISILKPLQLLREKSWNEFSVEIDVGEVGSFFVGYQQLSLNGPVISLDLRLPHSGRSYRRESVNRLWQKIPNGDLAIEVVFEYFSGN